MKQEKREKRKRGGNAEPVQLKLLRRNACGVSWETLHVDGTLGTGIVIVDAVEDAQHPVIAATGNLSRNHDRPPKESERVLFQPGTSGQMRGSVSGKVCMRSRGDWTVARDSLDPVFWRP